MAGTPEEERQRQKSAYEVREWMDEMIEAYEHRHDDDQIQF